MKAIKTERIRGAGRHLVLPILCQMEAEMKRILSIWIVLALTPLIAVVTPTYAQQAPTLAVEDDGPLLPGRWMPDITIYDLGKWDGNFHVDRLAKAQPGDRVPGWWWQRTTNQNSIIDHMNSDATTGGVFEPAPGVHVLRRADNGGVMSPPTGNDPAGGGPIVDAGGGGNSVIVETSNYTILIGTGGNTYNTEVAIKYINTYIHKPLRWIIIPDLGDASYRDASAAAKYATPEVPLTVIMALSFVPSWGQLNSSYATNVYPPNWSTTGERLVEVNGGLPILPVNYRVPRDLSWRLSVPSMSGSPLLCPTVAPYDKIPPIPNVMCVYVQNPTLTVPLQDVQVRLSTSIDEIGALTVYFPQKKLLVAPSLFGGYLPDLAPLTGPVIPSSKVLKALSEMLDLDVDIYLSLHDQPMVDEQATAMIQAQQAVLQELSDYTRNGLKNNTNLEDLVAGVSLSQSVRDKCAPFEPASPCSELRSSLGQVVRGIYSEYVGWFDGNARDLGTHLTAKDRAQILVDAAGGASNLLYVAKKAQTTAQDLKSVERALLMIEPLYELSPDNADVRLVYYQALYKAGLMQKNNQLRNYYLYLAWMIRPIY